MTAPDVQSETPSPSETDPKEPTVPAAKKATAKKAAARPRKRAESAPKPATSRVTIYLVGESYNGAHGDRRVTDEANAAELVKAGLARYAKAQ